MNPVFYWARKPSLAWPQVRQFSQRFRALSAHIGNHLPRPSCCGLLVALRPNHARDCPLVLVLAMEFVTPAWPPQVQSCVSHCSHPLGGLLLALRAVGKRMGQFVSAASMSQGGRMNILLTGADGFLGRHIARRRQRRSGRMQPVSRRHGIDFSRMYETGADRTALLRGGRCDQLRRHRAEVCRKKFTALHAQAPMALFAPAPLSQRWCKYLRWCRRYSFSVYHPEQTRRR